MSLKYALARDAGKSTAKNSCSSREVNKMESTIIKKQTEVWTCGNCGAILREESEARQPVQVASVPIAPAISKNVDKRQHHYWTIPMYTVLREVLAKGFDMVATQKELNAKFGTNLSPWAVGIKMTRINSNACVSCAEPVIKKGELFCPYHMVHALKESRVNTEASIAHRRSYQYHHWTAQMERRLADLKAENKDPQTCADILTAQFQLNPPLTRSSVYNKLTLLRILPKCLACGKAMLALCAGNYCTSCAISLKNAGKI
jgi:uncharacterized Zn finger protein (UPF0148 family)